MKALVLECRKRLAPFGEPLELDLGLNRWLSGEREESWSNWFDWFFRHLTAHDVCVLFGIDDWIAEDDQVKRVERVERECWVESGHEGATGRLDIAIWLPGLKAVLVEIKLSSADNADIEKHKGYVDATKKWDCECKYFLLVTDAPFDKDRFGFTVLRYDTLCLRMRRWIADAAERNQSHAFLALALALVGAIESQLLTFSVGNHLASDATIDHLSTFVGNAA